MAKLRVVKNLDGKRVWINPDQVTCIEQYQRTTGTGDQAVTETVSVIWLVGEDKSIDSLTPIEEISTELFSL